MEFTEGQEAIIDKKIHKAISAFRTSNLLSEDGICSMQHENMILNIKNSVREELTTWKDTITKRIIYSLVLVIITQVIVAVFVR